VPNKGSWPSCKRWRQDCKAENSIEITAGILAELNMHIGEVENDKER
jgi:hypothetical protein